jgi:sugar-specific transcriptional regulator TrmB
MSKLQAAGLNETEASVYEVLLKKKHWRPSELAKSVNESRTNMYKILDKLVDKKLAVKFDYKKKLHYRATNPSQLLDLAREHRNKMEADQKELELQAQILSHDFIKTHEQPAVRYFQGKKEIKTIFDLIENSKEEVYFVHTYAGVDFYGFEAMHKLRIQAVKKNVKRRGLTPDNAIVPTDWMYSDKRVGLTRTWLRPEDYNAPVEWGAFEDKLYIISYGEDALGIILESKQIAQAFRQIFKIMERGQKQQPWYNQLPRLAKKDPYC